MQHTQLNSLTRHNLFPLLSIHWQGQPLPSHQWVGWPSSLDLARINCSLFFPELFLERLLFFHNYFLTMARLFKLTFFCSFLHLPFFAPLHQYSSVSSYFQWIPGQKKAIYKYKQARSKSINNTEKGYNYILMPDYIPKLIWSGDWKQQTCFCESRTKMKLHLSLQPKGSFALSLSFTAHMHACKSDFAFCNQNHQSNRKMSRIAATACLLLIWKCG